MKKLTKVGVALGALAATLILPSVPATSAQEATASTPTGYTVVMNDGGCELATINLTTGQLTDLPAGPSPEACAVDLAISPGGVVYGVTYGGGSPTSAPSAVVATLVTFSMNGTPTSTPIDVPGAEDGSLIYGGIAVSPGGTIYAQLVADEAGCDTGTTPDTTVLGPVYAGDSVCLYTVNPTNGVATLVGTTGFFETPFYGLASCGGLTTIIVDGEEQAASWASESATTGLATSGAPVQTFPVGYDCNSTTGAPLWALTTPNGSGPISPQATQVSVAQVNPATGVTTAIVPISDQSADLMALAVVPAAATPPPAASPAVVTPAFTG